MTEKSSIAEEKPRVISIQSHVVHGYVGQKAAMLPLQLLGFDVDAIHTVQFSNHTGYEAFAGDCLNGSQLHKLIADGLMKNDLLSGVTHLLTGYMRSREILEEVVWLLERLTEQRAEHALPPVRYVCDPVLGDDGRLYVPKEMVEGYRDQLIGRAFVITPNAFELQMLAKGEPDLLRACDWLHRERQVRNIVVTSGCDGACTMDGEMHVLLSTGAEEPKQWFLVPKRLAMDFTGSGDLTAALILAWSHREPDLGKAVQIALSTVYHVLRRTLEEGRPNQPGMAPELLLVESIDDIRRPTLVCDRVQSKIVGNGLMKMV